MLGSPPRVWGQSHRFALHSLWLRFTPTCVGTIAIAAAASAPSTVHPHVCGDNAYGEPRAYLSYGSPPRVWGQCGIWLKGHLIGRFTPTCVGTIKHRVSSFSRKSVHPHVCGDNGSVDNHSGHDNGSPPRVWGQCLKYWLKMLPWRFTPTCVGTICADIILGRPYRFTPTCVGTIRCLCHRLWPNAVHPHVCGDNWSWL